MTRLAVDFAVGAVDIVAGGTEVGLDAVVRSRPTAGEIGEIWPCYIPCGTDRKDILSSGRGNHSNYIHTHGERERERHGGGVSCWKRHRLTTSLLLVSVSMA